MVAKGTPDSVSILRKDGRDVVKVREARVVRMECIFVFGNMANIKKRNS